ncbi:MAG: two-component sensor histidine kinase [Alphaproteobacteria bacterium]|nr:two-component sensor histidine kinase [Alphaproteobacteria bacterium]
MAWLKRFVPRGLFWRSLLILLVPLVLLQCVVAYIFYERHWDTISRRLALGIAGDIVYVMRELQQEDNNLKRRWILETARKEMQIDINMEDDAILPNVAPELSSRIIDRVLHAAIAERLYFPFHIDTRRTDGKLSIRIQLQNEVMNVLTPRKRLDSSTTYIFVLWMVGTSLIVAALAILFLRNQIRPIRRLADAADAFGKGQDAKNFKPSGAREIRQAANAFVKMRARIRRYIDQRTEMLAGVSHDLRTPLTRMKLQLAMLEITNKEESRIKEISDDIAEMEHMIDEYLSFARGQEGEVPVDTNLNDMLQLLVEVAKKSGTNIKYIDGGPILIPIRPKAMKRCLTNLIENAAHFGNDVRITSKRSNIMIEILIEDNGPGVPNDQKEAVFKPFYQINTARSPNIGGAGLGLAIARDVARGHGGDIKMFDSDMGGLKAELRIPI